MHSFVSTFVKSYRYFWCSVIFHAVLIFALTHIVQKPAVDNTIDQRVKVSINNTYRMSMQQSVKNTMPNSVHTVPQMTLAAMCCQMGTGRASIKYPRSPNRR